MNALLKPRLRSLLSSITAAMTVVVCGSHAHADTASNGVSRNGAQVNGLTLNGVRLNGTQLESTAPDGNPPAAAGTTLAATSADGTALPMVIVSRSNKGIAYQGSFYKSNRDVWWNIVHWGIPHAANVVGVAMPATTPNMCVQKVVAAMPACSTQAWTKACVVTAKTLCRSKPEQAQLRVAYGESICGNDDRGKPRQAIFLGGDWDGNSGTQGAGGKIADAESGAISIGCRKVGAIAKCVDFGYKPWVSPAMDDMHQACVRMVRADFCGDGTPWTIDGNLIDIADVLAIQTPDSKDFVFEATWTKAGATFLNAALDFRTAMWGAHIVSPHLGVTFAQYQKTHPYCAPKRVTSIDSVPSVGRAAAPIYSLADTVLEHRVNPLRTKRPAVCPTATGTGVASTCTLGL